MFFIRYFTALDRPLAPKMMVLGLRIIALFFIFAAFGAMIAAALQGQWFVFLALLLALPIVVVASLTIPEFFVAIIDLRRATDRTSFEMYKLRKLNEAFAKGQSLPHFDD